MASAIVGTVGMVLFFCICWASCVDAGNTSVDSEAQILLAFKAGLSNGSTGALTNWNPDDVSACGWTGVTCFTNTSHVQSLNLTNLALEGPVSPELGGLKFLEILELSMNKFQGSLPTTLGNLSQLTWLSVTSNFLTGGIPTELGALEYLQDLHLGQNNLTGSIPDSLTNCTQLARLYLYSNQFTGPIPFEIGKLSNLQSIYAGENSLTGEIPSSIGNCSALTVLSLEYNQLGGEIPQSIGQLKNLTILSLSANNLTGLLPSSIANISAINYFLLNGNTFDAQPFPEWIGALTQMYYMDFQNVGLYGEIPTSIRNLSNLYVFLASGNQLSGRIPAELGQLPNLEDIEISYNSLSGEIPNIIGSLSNLQTFYLISNNLSGPIPASLGNCSALQSLALSNNFLSGAIPFEFGKLTNLQVVYLFNNALQGPLPESLANLTSVTKFTIGLNNLTGAIFSGLGSMKNLTTFDLSYNRLDETIPESTGNLQSLLWLDLSYNLLGGSLPASFGNLSTLQQLYLQSNRLVGSFPIQLRLCKSLGDLRLNNNFFTGSIPTELGQLQSLERLHLQNNNFSGIIPSSVGQCTHLLDLDLSNNSLSGSIPGAAIANLSAGLVNLSLSQNFLDGLIPSELGNLVNLQLIDLSRNNLSGSIPSSLGQCTELKELDLSFNELDGEIPESLGLLELLQQVNFSYNNLQGQIPDSGVFANKSLASAFLGNPGLCGQVLDTACPSPSSNDKSKCHGITCKAVWIPVTVVSVIVLVFGAIACHWFWRVWAWEPGRNVYNTDVQLYFTTDDHKLTAHDLSKATGAFNEQNIIGVGAKSKVYKGILPGGDVIAVKLIQMEHNADKRALKELSREVQALLKVRHRHVVKIIGLCANIEMKALILEFLPNGSLYKQLYEVEICDLSWEKRFSIALGIAQGLEYLHEECPDHIIHGDLKPSNILLDSNYVAKISDFGIARFVNSVESSTKSLSGTRGYIPPEYGISGVRSTKGDVYSFGVILLELVTRRQPTELSFGGNASLVDWVLQQFPSNAQGIIDHAMAKEMPDFHQQMLLVMRIGLLCTSESPNQRPAMGNVVAMLQQVKRLFVQKDDNRRYPTVEELANLEARLSGTLEPTQVEISEHSSDWSGL